MKNVNRFVTVCVLAVSTLAAIPAMAQKPGAPQPLPVTVQNTPSVNVANIPSVNVSNTPNVTVTNTPSVSVTNTPSVNVANTPSVTLESGASVAVTSPLDGQGNPTPIATLEAVQLYGSACGISFDAGGNGSCAFTTVPQGEELVVQEFDAFGLMSTGDEGLLSLENTIAGSNYFPYTVELRADGIDTLATHQETRVYVAQGNTPICYVELFQTGNAQYACDISGFLVDVPSGQQPTTVQQQKPQLQELLRKLRGR